MKFYIEITLLPTVDINIGFLWGKLYQQIHLALVDMSYGNGNGSVPIGVGFPQYDTEKNRLGNKLRLFAKSESDLVKMDINKWLNRLLDYVDITPIREVPSGVATYSVYKRQQSNRSSAKLERLIKRRAKRENISIQEARSIIIANAENKKLKKDNEHLLKTAFINMKSISSNNRFHLFILKKSASNCFEGDFSCYGLSEKSTVPEF
jgi:CRISPR-associated endonuclease Csy4